MSVQTLTAPDQFYGVLTIGTSQVALPLSDLREVIPCPQQLIALPSPAAGLLGAVDLRGQVIPVLDLRFVLGMDVARGPEQVVVVVIHDGRVLGLLADEVRGVTTTPAEALHAMTAVGDVELLFSHSFERTEDASVVSVLDVAAIYRLPGTPVIRDAPVAPARTGDAGGPGAEGDPGRVVSSMLLMRCDRIGLGIEIEHVHATLPYLDVRDSPLRHGVCVGVVEYGGAQVPVIDPLQLMGMGSLPTERVQGLVLRLEAGLIVLLLTEIIEIVQIQAREVLTLPPFTVRRPKFFRGVVQAGDLGGFLLLSSDALLESEELQTLSTFNLRDADGAVPTGQDDWASSVPAPRDGADAGELTPSTAGGGLYLTYSVITELASPLEQILEILPYPTDFASIGEGDGVVLGLLTHRDAVVPLICLSTLMGGPPTDLTASCVLLVEAGAGAVGLVVRSLGAIERSVWEELDDAPAAPLPHDPVQRALVDKRTIRTAPVGSTGSERMLSRINLQAIACALASGER